MNKILIITIVVVLLLSAIVIPVTIILVKNNEKKLINSSLPTSLPMTSLPMTSLPTSLPMTSLPVSVPLPSYYSAKIVDIPNVIDNMNILDILNNNNFFSLSSCAISLEFQVSSAIDPSWFFILGSINFGFNWNGLLFNILNNEGNTWLMRSVLISPSGTSKDGWINNMNYKVVINMDSDLVAGGYNVYINNIQYENQSSSLTSEPTTGSPYTRIYIKNGITFVSGTGNEYATPSSPYISKNVGLLKNGNMVATIKNFKIFNRTLTIDEIDNLYSQS
jgi:hypothetical protein